MSMTSAMPSAANVNRASQLGIHAYDSRNWKRSPPAWNAIHITMLSTSTASDQTNATCLASWPGPRDEGHHHRPHQREQRQDGQERKIGHANHPSWIARKAPTTRRAPVSMDSAYERTKPVCSRRSRPELPPTLAAMPLTSPSMPLLSRKTSARVR